MNMDAQEAALGLLSMGMGSSGINGAGSSSSSAASLGLGGGQQGTYQSHPSQQQQQQQQRSLHHHHHHSSSSSTTTTTTIATTGSPVSFPPPPPHQNHHYQPHPPLRQHSPPSSSSSPHPHSHQQQQQQQQQQHLHPHHFPPPTSSATLNSILGPPSSSPLIPAKRKIVLLDEGYETGRALRGGIGPGEGRDMGLIRDGREMGIGSGMVREVQGFGVGYGRISAQRDEGEMMRMGMGTPLGRSSTTAPPQKSPSSTSVDSFHHRPSSRPTSSSSTSGPHTASFNPYPQPPPLPATTTTTGKGRVSSPLYLRGSMPPPTPISPPPPPITAMPITTPPSRKSKLLPPPDPPPLPVSNNTPPPSMPPSQPTSTAPEPTSTDGIDCICSINIDDGYSVACDECGRWCHMACFNFPPSGQGQNAASDIEFRCWRCEPRSPGMAVRAREIMKGKMAARGGGGGGGAIAASTSGGGEGGDGRRRSPVGSVEGGRKGRKTSAPVGNAETTTGKRKRRNSGGANTAPNGVVTPLTAITATTTPTTTTPAAGVAGATTTTGEEEHVEIDEPWNQAYVHIREDIVTDDETRQKLRLHAKNWRGIIALVDDPSSSSPQPSSSSPVFNPTTKLKPIPQNIISAQPLLSPSYTSSHPSILPPSYALHTTTPLPSNSLIIPLKSRISTSTSYLRDPLNSYAHLGMPRPFVHLMGPPLDLSLDGRCVGNEARWVRNGCVPNAVLRPVLCKEGKGRRRKGRVEMVKGKEKEGEEMGLDGREGEGEKKVVGKGKEKAGEEDDTTLGFALFATRDLKANEEVVLGWEWDDGNVVHLLPALMDAPGMFRTPPTSSSPSQILTLRNQMANILHALSSTFATCACGTGSKSCVLSRMKAFVQSTSSIPFSLSSSHQASSRDNSTILEANMWAEALNMALDATHGREGPDLGPLVGTDKRRGFRTRERLPGSGGLGGMEMVPPRVVKGNMDGEGKTTGKGKGKERVVVEKLVEAVDPQRQQHDLRPFDPGTQEERIHPRMRKKWMKEVVEKKREGRVMKTTMSAETSAIGKEKKGLSEDELAMLAMPPPPMPASLDPTTISSAEEARRVTIPVSEKATDERGVMEQPEGKGVGMEAEEEKMQVDVPQKVEEEVSRRRDEAGDVPMDDVQPVSQVVEKPPEAAQVSSSIPQPPTSPTTIAPKPLASTTAATQPSRWISHRPSTDSRESSSTPEPPALLLPPLQSAPSVNESGVPPSSATSIGPPPSSATSIGPLPSSASTVDSDTSSVVTVQPVPPPPTATTIGEGDGDETEDEHDPLFHVQKVEEGKQEEEVANPPIDRIQPQIFIPQPKSVSPPRSSPPLSEPPASSPSTRSASSEASPIPHVQVLPPDSEENVPPNTNTRVNGHSARFAHSASPIAPQRPSLSLTVSPQQSSATVLALPGVKSPALSPRQRPSRIDTDLVKPPVQPPELDSPSPTSPTWSLKSAGDTMEGVEEGKVNEEQKNEKVEDKPTPDVQPTSPAQSTEFLPAATEPVSAEAEPEPEPTPVPAAKKKLSLAEFIARKKKLKEEGQGQGATTPTAGGLTPTAGPGATLTPTLGPGASLGPVSGPGLGAGMTSAASGVISANLTPTNGPAPTLTSTPPQAATLAPTPGLSAASTPSAPPGAPLPALAVSGGPGTSFVGGQTIGLGLSLAGGGISSATVSSVGKLSVIGESEEKDRMVVDTDEMVRKDRDDVMSVDEERSVNGRDQNESKENLSPLLTMREMKDGSHPSSAVPKDVKKTLDSPAHHALSPLIGVGSLNMHLTNGHASTPVHSLSPVPPSTLGLGLGLGVPSSHSLAPSPLSQSPDVTTKEAKKELVDVSLSVMNPANRKATASPAILGDEHRFSRKPPSPPSTITSAPQPLLSSATSSSPPPCSTPTQKLSTPPPPSASSGRPTVHAPAPSAPSPLGLAPASPIHPDARNWQASPPPAFSSLSSPTMNINHSPVNGPRMSYRYNMPTTMNSERTTSAHARRQSQEDGEIGEHESEGDGRRHSASSAPHPSTSHNPHSSSFNTPPPSSANPIGPKRGVVPFPFRQASYPFAPNVPNHSQHTPSHSPPTHPRSFSIKPTLPSRPGVLRPNGVASDADSSITPTSASASTPTSGKPPTLLGQVQKPTTTPSTPSTMPSNYGQVPPTAPRALRQSINNKPPNARPPYAQYLPHHPYPSWSNPANTPSSTEVSNGAPNTSSTNCPSTPTANGNGAEHFIPRGPASQMRDRHKDDLDRDRDVNLTRDRDRCLPGGSRWDSPSAHRDGPDRDVRDGRDARDARDGHYAGGGPGLGRYRGGMSSRGKYGSWGDGWRR